MATPGPSGNGAAASSSRAGVAAGGAPQLQGLMKERVTERFCNYQVNGVNFTALSDTDITQYGEMEVLNPALYDFATETALPFGPLDKRMGSCSKRDICATCGQRLEECVGHFGHVRLALPVFHAGYFRHTVTVLQCVCKACGRVLLAPDERGKYLARLRRPTTDDHQRSALTKKLVEACKKVRTCPYCSHYNSQVRKGTGVPLICKHALAPHKTVPDDVSRLFVESFADAKSHNGQIAEHADNAQEDLNPLVAYNLLRMMPSQDRELLWIVRPERLIMTTVPVPPICIRPTVSMGDKGTREDDLTQGIADIVEANNMLRSQMQRGGQPRGLLEAWQYLQEKCCIIINSEVAGLNLPKGRPIRSLCTRLKGKEGRFRGNLSGKRVDFSGRTVISPDPNVSVEQLVVPEWIAKRMTFPEKVCEANLGRLREAIKRGPEAHPGACFVRMVDGRGKYLGALRKNFRRQIAESLQCGDTVERHMHDGDVVLFNRQPSLHRLSIMAHRAKVMTGRTLRFNECACAPYNADFDGDEMNLHLPQTEEARAEALQLMGVRHGLVTPKSGEVAVCATQDFLTGAFLMTQKDTFFSRDRFCQLCAELTEGAELVELPPPAILKPVELWTGKQVFSVLLRPNRNSKVLVNLEAPEKNYTKKGESMCLNDGYVIFRNSELLSGNLGKKILGGAKNGIFFRLIRDSGPSSAIACMSRLAKVTSRFLMNRGMTIGIDDVNAEYGRLTASRASKPGVTQEKHRITEDKYTVVGQRIKEYNTGTLQLKPGCNAEQTLEAVVNGELGQIRDLVGGMCEQTLHYLNKPCIMATCGSKGSAINLCQMMACVGQQNVGGQRIKNGFVNRTLPHFLKGSKEPKARGFVENSFYSGLEPPEFFFHTMGGREGLVDTAVKTAETGYMARRLMKALEDLALKYDLTVRTSAGDVVQFAFGDDGLNPAKMEGSGSKPLDYEYVLQHVQKVLQPPTVHSTEEAEPPRKRPRADGAGGGAGGGGLSSAASVALMASNKPLPLPSREDRTLSSSASAPAKRRLAAEGKASKAVPIRRSAEEMQSARYRVWPLLPLELKELAGPCADSFSAFIRRTQGGAELDISHCRDSLATFIRGLAKDVAQKRARLCLEIGDTPDSAMLAKEHATLAEVHDLTDVGSCPTQWHLEAFVNRCAVKYVQAMLMPGEAVGAVAAQSIAEPATQMTLKTFHFAGVASMNVTLGVPRIKEIINASKAISTPIITCSLVDQHCEASARIVKGRIERTTLGDVCLYFKEVYHPSLGCFVSVKVNMETVRRLQLELDISDIKAALLLPKALGSIRLAPTDVDIVGVDKIRVKPPFKKEPGASNKMLFFSLQTLKKALPHAVVKGLSSTKRAVINKDDKKSPIRYEILVEGYGFQQVMAMPGVTASKTTSNHVIEVEKVLGIEAARRTIMQEIQTTMGGHGIAVDARHIQMLGDCMTYRGAVFGINRFGISRMRTSALMLASFERTTDLVFDAAAHEKVDPVTGVSECIIMGSTVNLGTGLFKILYDYGGKKPPFGAGSPPPVPTNPAAPAGSSLFAAAARSAGAKDGAEASAGVASFAQRTPLLERWKRKQ